MAIEHDIPCPFCGGTIFPKFERHDPTKPTGEWLCSDCMVASGRAFACGGGLDPEDLAIDASQSPDMLRP